MAAPTGRGVKAFVADAEAAGYVFRSVGRGMYSEIVKGAEVLGTLHLSPSGAFAGAYLLASPVRPPCSRAGSPTSSHLHGSTW